MDATERFLENAPRLAEIVGVQPVWLSALRKEGHDSFAERGFPSSKDEEWKYTSLVALSRQSFTLAGDAGLAAAADLVQQERLAGAHLLVFVDGEMATDLCSVGELPEGVMFTSLRHALVKDEAWVRRRLGAQAKLEAWPLTALNAALWRDGLALRVPAKVVLEQPLQVIYLTTAQKQSLEVQLRSLVEVGESAQVRLIESYVGLEGAQASFTNVVSEVTLGDNARLDRVKSEREGDATFHVGRFELRQGRDSSFRSHIFSLSGKLLRDDLNTRFEGEGGECELYGLFFASGDHLVDHHTVVDHAVPRCRSVESYKGVIDGKARGVFNGKVIVREDAQHTDSQQSNKNLLLSESATINSKPQLEIFADDVKCAHGATVGQLDEDALFYLRARGIGLEEARSMLIRAFAVEVTEGVHDEALREGLETAFVAQLTHTPRLEVGA